MFRERKATGPLEGGGEGKLPGGQCPQRRAGGLCSVCSRQPLLGSLVCSVGCQAPCWALRHQAAETLLSGSLPLVRSVLSPRCGLGAWCDHV